MHLMLYGISNCDTVKKSREWLNAKSISYSFHDYKTQGVTSAKLGEWADEVGWDVLLNRAGTTFRKLHEAERADLDRGKAIALMVAQPSSIKRPVVEGAGPLLVGFKPDLWAAAFG